MTMDTRREKRCKGCHSQGIFFLFEHMFENTIFYSHTTLPVRMENVHLEKCNLASWNTLTSTFFE